MRRPNFTPSCDEKKVKEVTKMMKVMMRMKMRMKMRMIH